jgi:hypothetical protein
MDKRDAFFEAFQDELQKEALWSGLVQAGSKILPYAQRAITAVKGFAGRLGARAAASPAVQGAGKWLGAHPKTKGALNFAGEALVTGAAGDVGMSVFQPRKKIIEVAPEAMGQQHLLKQYR